MGEDRVTAADALRLADEAEARADKCEIPLLTKEDNQRALKLTVWTDVPVLCAAIRELAAENERLRALHPRYVTEVGRE